MRSMLQDLRYAFRSLGREPTFATIAVLTLAAGIGANVAIFSVVYGVLLRPLPYKDAGGLVSLWQTNPKGGVERDKVSPGNFLDWQDRNTAFAEMASAEPYGFDLSGEGEPERVKAWRVSEGFFRVLGARAERGRLFLPEEERERSVERAVVVSHGFWQRRYGSDPGLIGGSLLLNGEPYHVVGVLPSEFLFPPDKEVWVTRAFGEEDRQLRTRTNLHVVARLRPGAEVEQAQSQIAALASEIAREDPQANGMGVAVVPIRDLILGEVRPALLVLLCAVGLVLLIACANVANLLMARGVRRQRELAERAAFGATRSRLFRQLLTESLLLALLGGAGGVLLAHLVVRSVRALSPGNLPRIQEVGLNAPVLVFALGLAVLTAVLFGAIPSLRLSSPDLRASLSQGGSGALGGSSQRHLRNLLVVLEVALALLLLIGAGLLFQSFFRLLRIDAGFVADRVAVLEVHVWSRFHEPEQQSSFFDRAVQRITAVPGVQAAGVVSSLPFLESRADIEASFTIPGRPVTGDKVITYQTTVSPDYFRVLGIPLRRGRLFNRFDRRGSLPVALINEEMARRHWPTEDPMGKKIQIGSSGEEVEREIVGVVGDVRHTGLDGAPRPEVFVPSAQEPFGSMAFVVKTASDPVVLLPEIKRAVWDIEKEQTFSSTGTLNGLVDASIAERRFSLMLLGFFAAVALVLAVAGIYGLMSFSTQQRRREIGLRMALGARASDISRMVLREGMTLLLAGVVLGVLGALALTRWLQTLLFEVTPSDPVTFATLSALLVMVGLLAGYIPARSAARVDPMESLRSG